MIVKVDTQGSPSSVAQETLTRSEEELEVSAAARTVSGLYTARADDDDDVAFHDVAASNGAATRSVPVLAAARAGREELRLDVDGPYPQRVASGVAVFGQDRVHWIAALVSSGANRWMGTIGYKDGPPNAFPYTQLQLQVTSDDDDDDDASVKVTFEAPGGQKRSRRLRYKSPYFHSVDFEFDSAAGEAATTRINTCAHPNRPATMPCEELSIRKVYRRAGFDVTESKGGSVPIAGSGPDARWSDAEMHDAMQVFWSHFDAKAQWAMWVFFASLHEQGTSLGGVMFDDIGPNHRQGTAIFNDAFISVPPNGDPNPAAWVQRMIFWTACHEMGHAFNLAHSWQKSLGTPWIPGMADQPEARSFMNYPFKVQGGQTAFFADFEYRFSNDELLFLRHAPERFVQMGNADWFDHHGFEQGRVSPETSLQLDLRVNREVGLFEFLEPVTLELKLSNISATPQLVDSNLLNSFEALTVVVKAQGRPARTLLPFARRCYLPEMVVLGPGEAIYAPLNVSTGLNGWHIDEPGRYLVQVALRRDNEDLISNPLTLRIAPPVSHSEELLAQDLFTEDVGRVLDFSGSQVLSSANEVLRTAVDRHSDRRIAIHAALALARPVLKDYKVLKTAADQPTGLEVETRSARPGEAYGLVEGALVDRATEALETLGHIAYAQETNSVADSLAQEDHVKGAARVEDAAYDALSNRLVRGRKVLSSVLDRIAAERDRYRALADDS